MALKTKHKLSSSKGAAFQDAAAHLLCQSGEYKSLASLSARKWRCLHLVKLLGADCRSILLCRRRHVELIFVFHSIRAITALVKVTKVDTLGTFQLVVEFLGEGSVRATPRSISKKWRTQIGEFQLFMELVGGSGLPALQWCKMPRRWDWPVRYSSEL
jgi:hypothetical protein